MPEDYRSWRQSSRLVNDYGHCLPEETTAVQVLEAEPKAPLPGDPITRREGALGMMKDCHAGPMFSAQWRRVYSSGRSSPSLTVLVSPALGAAVGPSSCGLVGSAALAVTIHDPCRTLSLFGSRY